MLPGVFRDDKRRQGRRDATRHGEREGGCRKSAPPASPPIATTPERFARATTVPGCPGEREGERNSGVCPTRSVARAQLACASATLPFASPYASATVATPRAALGVFFPSITTTITEGAQWLSFSLSLSLSLILALAFSLFPRFRSSPCLPRSGCACASFSSCAAIAGGA